MSKIMTGTIKRRRVIKLMAATVATLLAAPRAGLAIVRQRRAELYSWHGFALGAEVSLQLYHHDALAARRIIQGSVKIIRKMEQLFSLYRESSALSELNREGVLYEPEPEFYDLMRAAKMASVMTSGAFDITVQPLWKYYHSFFEQYPAGTPVAEQLSDIRQLVDHRKLSVSRDRVGFDRRGMAATLNGIAQGYATDQVTDYLKKAGMTSVLVDIGEYRALGPQADQSPWRIGLMDPEHPGEFSEILDVMKGAVATSSSSGDRFEATGRYNHLFDPHSGLSANRYLSVTVTAPTATLADSLSTAFCVMPEGDIEKCLKQLPAIKARLTHSGGRVVTL